jgi:hypothetical protein
MTEQQIAYGLAHPGSVSWDAVIKNLVADAYGNAHTQNGAERGIAHDATPIRNAVISNLLGAARELAHDGERTASTSKADALYQQSLQPLEGWKEMSR